MTEFIANALPWAVPTTLLIVFLTCWWEGVE